MSTPNPFELNIKQFQDLLTDTSEFTTPIIAWGPPGIGKTAVGEAYAKARAEELGLPLIEYGQHTSDPAGTFGLITMHPTDMDPVDVGGMPDKDPETLTQVRLPVDWFPHTERHDLPDRGILIIDELASAERSVQVTFHQLLSDGRIGSKRIKPGWRVIALSNDVTDGGYVHKMLTTVENRLCHVYVRSDWECFLGHVAPLINLHPIVKAFIKMYPDELNTFETHMATGRKGHSFATERTIHKTSNLLWSVNHSNRFALSVMVAGLIGTGACAKMMGMFDIWQTLPDIDSLIRDPDRAPVNFDPATAIAVTTALEARINRDTATNVMRYLNRCQPEMVVKTFTCLHSRPEAQVLFETREYGEWASRNSNLFRHGG